MEDNHDAIVDNEIRKVGLSWRILVGLVAIAIIGFLAYPFLQEQLNRSASPSAQSDSNSAESQFNTGNAYYEAGDWEQAILAYKRAIELDPSYQAAYANLGVTYYQQQKFDLAALQYQKALELNPNDGEVAYNLGALYLQQALSQSESPDPVLINQAIEQLNKAMEISPNLAEPHFSLGVAHMALGQQEKAIENFETYLTLDPNKSSQASQEAQRYLQDLRAQ